MKTFCYHCGSVFDVLDSDRDKEIQCPECRKAFYADVCDEFGLPAGAVSEGNKPPLWELSTIERVCTVLVTFDAVAMGLFFLGSIVWVMAALDRSPLFAVAVLIGSCVQLIVMFSIAWGLFAVSELISQMNNKVTTLKGECKLP